MRAQLELIRRKILRPLGIPSAKRCADVMKQPAGQKLYIDLSYESEVLQSLDDGVVVSRLTDLMTCSSSLLSERLMYGSDWLLLGLEPRREYAKRMETVIDKTEKRSGATGFKARFFGGNAASG
jgi:hypothetical protein